MAMRRLSQWISPVSESVAKYPSSTLSQNEVPDSSMFDGLPYSDYTYHLDNVYLINIAKNPNDVKNAIMTYGAAGISYYHDEDNYYKYYKMYNTNYEYSYAFNDADHNTTNHAVMIVGWDDEFSKDNFNTKPSIDGAWLVRNSWGSTYDYFWMSYETLSLTTGGGQTAYVFDAGTDTYEYNYQLDGGVFLTSDNERKSVANIYQVQSKDDGEYDALKAINISLTGAQNVGYTVDVYTNCDKDNPVSGDKHEEVVSGKTNLNGVYTIELDETIYLEPDSYYSIVVNFDSNTKTDIEYAYNGDSAWKQTVANNNNSFYLNENTNEYSVLKYSNAEDGIYGNYSIKGFANDAYTLTFDLTNGGTLADTTRLLESGSAYGTLPTPTTSDGLTFKGWYTSVSGGTPVTAATTISENTTIYAQYETPDYATVTLYPNGGTLNKTTYTYIKDSTYGELPEPTYENHQFKGWYTAETGGTKIESTDTVSDDITLYARWAVLYTVTFDANGGTLASASDATRTVANGDAIGTLPTVTREGYTLASWYTTASSAGIEVDESYPVVSKLTVYARWTPNTYTIIFDSNDNNGYGSGSMGALTVTYDQSIKLTKNAFTNRILEFKEWNTQSTGGGITYADEAIVSNLVSENNGSITLYAQWIHKTNTITFIPNGGTVDPTSRTVDTGSQFSQFPTPSKSGYKFLGWYDELDGGTKYDVIGTVWKDYTFYAHWGDLNKITFNPNGGSLSDGDKTRLVDDNQAIGSLPTPTRNGYKFLGWFTSSERGDQIDASTTVTKDTTYYAHWQANQYEYTLNFVSSLSGNTIRTLTGLQTYDSTYKLEDITGYTKPYESIIFGDTKEITLIYTPIVYTITYDLSAYGLNKGDNPDTYTVESDTITLNDANKKTESSVIFAGWYKDSGYTTKVTQIPKGSTGNITLYADWTQVYVATFDYNDGTGNSATVNVVKNDTLETSEVPVITKEGFTFDGWYTANTGGSKVEFPKVINASQKFYAHWLGNYTIRFVSTKGTVLGTKTENAKEYGTIEDYTLPEYDGYNKPNYLITYSDNLTIDIVYTPIEYTINYELDGGENATNNPTKYTIEDEITLADPTYPSEDKLFNAWYTDAALQTQGNTIAKGSTGEKTFYAKWDNNYQVNFNLNYPGGEVISQRYRAGSVIDLPVPQRDGYIFNSWTTAPEASGSSKIESPFTVVSSQTYYAQWDKSSTLTFDGNDGTPSETSRKVKVGETYGELPSASRIGYTFTGWYTSLDGDTQVSKDTVMTEEDVTIYAHWTINQYKVTFKDGDDVIDERTLDYDSEYGQLPVLAEKKGYDFVGWFNEAGEEVTSTSKVSDSDVIIIARWQSKENPTIKLNGNGGTPSADGITIDFDGKLIGSMPTATRVGYTFVGWYDLAEGGNSYNSESDFTDISELFAHWSINSYTLSFDSDGGSDIESKQVEYNSTLGELPTPKKDKYTFLGWFTSDNKEVTSETVMGASDLTIYAHQEYVPQEYTITLVYNDGTDNSTTLKVIEGKAIGSLPTLSKGGYTFLGWFDELNGGKEIKADTIMASSDLTIYGHWQVKSNPTPSKPDTPSDKTCSAGRVWSNKKQACVYAVDNTSTKGN